MDAVSQRLAAAAAPKGGGFWGCFPTLVGDHLCLGVLKPLWRRWLAGAERICQATGKTDPSSTSKNDPCNSRGITMSDDRENGFFGNRKAKTRSAEVRADGGRRDVGIAREKLGCEAHHA